MVRVTQCGVTLLFMGSGRSAMTNMHNIYQVDAFTNKLFGGNPAAVIPLEDWPDDATLLAIAQENNLSETAFLKPDGAGFELRWFTPAAEVALCGHATLASAHVVFNHLNFNGDSVAFRTRQSGTLVVTQRKDSLLAMQFPSIEVAPCDCPDNLVNALGVAPTACLQGFYSQDESDYIAVLDTEDQVRRCDPDLSELRQLSSRGLIVTAAGNDCDFVSRYFAPAFGIDEDPVTGSAHCLLAPYWGQRLSKVELRARQVSRRGGEIMCTLGSDHVILAGAAVDYLLGQIRY